MCLVYDLQGLAGRVLSESQVKSLTTMLSDPPFVSTQRWKPRVSRNEIYEMYYTCARG